MVIRVITTKRVDDMCEYCGKHLPAGSKVYLAYDIKTLPKDDKTINTDFNYDSIACSYKCSTELTY